MDDSFFKFEAFPCMERQNTDIIVYPFYISDIVCMSTCAACKGCIYYGSPNFPSVFPRSAGKQVCNVAAHANNVVKLIEALK